MHHHAFTGDGNGVVFASDRSGRFEQYRLDLRDNYVTRLTWRSSTPPESAYKEAISTISPNGTELIFQDGLEVLGVNIASVDTRLIARGDPSWQLMQWDSVADDGARVFCVFRDGDGRWGIATGGDGGMLEVLTRFDSQVTNVTHVLPIPDAELSLTFNLFPDRQDDASETSARRARAWRLDGRTGKLTPFLISPVGSRATHEFWGRGLDGQPRLFFHRKTVGTWVPASVESIDADGGDMRQHLNSADRLLGHSCLSRDGRVLVTDVQSPTVNELIRTDMTTGAHDVLCWPNSTSESSQLSHVHPVLDQSAKRLLFNSDVSGRAAVYMIELEPTAPSQNKATVR